MHRIEFKIYAVASNKVMWLLQARFYYNYLCICTYMYREEKLNLIVTVKLKPEMFESNKIFKGRLLLYWNKSLE